MAAIKNIVLFLFVDQQLITAATAAAKKQLLS